MLDAKSSSSLPCQVPSFLKRGQQKSGDVENMTPEQKALTSMNGSAGALIDPFRVPGIFAPPTRPFRLRDIMVVQSTDELQVQYVEETGFYQLYSPLVAEAALGQAVLEPKSTRGFYAGLEITIAVGTGAEEVKTIDSLDHDAGTLTVDSNLSNTHAVDVEIVADDFIFTTETKLKPTAHATFAMKTEGMKTLAHWIPASRQILRNRAMLRSHIDNRMMEGLKISEEKQILYGNGDSDQLQGILTHTDVQTYNWSSGTGGDEKIDAVRRAMTLSQLAEYPVDGIVMNPLDWEDIELTKGSDDHYIWVAVTSGGEMRLWRIPVIVTTAIKQGDFLVGAFRLGAALWDGEQANIRVSESHEDYFTKNMVAILAEQQMTMTVYRPEAFVYGSFDSEPT
jgi:hypothetical protein